jgi:nucleotide-binding universal stress UspA family protein
VIRRIVVPTDFSPQADAALEFATGLAKMSGAGICLVHIVENPVEGGAWTGKLYTVPVEADQNTLVEDAERRLKSMLSGLPAEFAAGSWVRTGDVASAIVSFARETDADLIVMGTTGRKGLGHLVIGSVAEHVVRYASCPVLTVPGRRSSRSR